MAKPLTLLTFPYSINFPGKLGDARNAQNLITFSELGGILPAHWRLL